MVKRQQAPRDTYKYHYWWRGKVVHRGITDDLGRREQEHPFWSARLFAIMGERDKALSLLERAYEDSTLGWLGYDKEFDFLRGEPRFKALLDKLGVPEVFDQYGQRIR